MEMRGPDGRWEKGWFVLDSASADLKGFARRPLSDTEPQIRSVSLEEVAQVSRSTIFCLFCSLFIFVCFSGFESDWWTGRQGKSSGNTAAH